MKMKYISIATIIAFLFASCGQNTTETVSTNEPVEEVVPEPVVETYTLAEGSTLDWKGYEEGKEEGHHHSGTVKIKSGSVETTDGKITGGNFTIGMDEIAYVVGASNGGEVTPDNEIAGKVLGHFTDSLFLNNISYPEAGFAILSSDENGVTGELTFAGSALSIVVPGTPAIEEGKLSHEAEFDLDLSSASAYLTESGWKIRMNLSLIATK
jgi:hypothetical protein